MILAVIYQNSSKDCLGFEIKGHAGYAAAGEDIVCAAVSMLVINTVNSIEIFTEEAFSFDSGQETGWMRLKFEKAPGEHAGLLCKSLILGLTSVESEYGKQFIKVEFKEV